MKNNQNLVNLLDLCADLFAFPSEDWCEKYTRLGEFAKGEFAEPFSEFSDFKFQKLLLSPKYDFDEIMSDYINFFDLNSAKFNTSLLAGIWLDKKMFGQKYDEICKFYNDCGYEISKNCDHLSNLLAFCAILAENGEFAKFDKFCKFLSWFSDLRLSLSQNKNLEKFEFILSFSEFAISKIRSENEALRKK